MSGVIRPLLAVAVFSSVTGVAAATSQSGFDQIWSHAEIFGDRKSGDYPALKLRGRYQGQLFDIDADGDGEADGEETRRLRLGLDTYLPRGIRIGFDLNLNSDGKEPFVDDFDYLQLSMKITGSTKLTLGKIRRKPLTLEDGTSSNSIITVERSLVANSVAPSNLGGVYIDHSFSDWTIGTGVLSGGLDDDLELPDGTGGLGHQVNLGHKLNKTTTWRLDYLFQDGDEDNDVFEPFRHTVSLNSVSEWGVFKLQTDLVAAESLEDGPGDLFGAVLLPSVKLLPQIEGVFRYTYLRSSESDGVRLGSRYERRADALAADRGREYHAFYGGANYYIYGKKLKFMLGVEHARLSRRNLKNYEALTALGAFRLYF